jgi:hypothetical protein
MDEEERKLLERAVELGEENQKIIKKIRGHQRAGMWFKVLYLFIIVVVLGVGYVYFRPYLQQAIGMYETVIGLKENIQNLEQKAGDMPGVDQLLNFLSPQGGK